jgi:hypothetical protein
MLSVENIFMKNLECYPYKYMKGCAVAKRVLLHSEMFGCADVKCLGAT